MPAGHLADHRSPTLVLAGGVAAFALAYTGFAFTDASLPILTTCFIAAGAAIGAVETGEHSAVATLGANDLRGSSFGALAGIQSLGNLVASSTTGILYASVSPTAAFLFPAAAMLLAASALLLGRTRR